MFYVTFNIGDYRKDTVHLSFLEHGIYRNLLDTYYIQEGPLILDKKLLMRTHSIRTPEEAEAFDFILSHYFIQTDFGYHHKRCDMEVAKFHEKSEKAKQSIKSRWEKYERNTNVSDSDTNVSKNDTKVILTVNRKPETGIANNIYRGEDGELDKTVGVFEDWGVVE